MRNRDPVFLLAAALLHAALLVVVWTTAPSPRTTGTPGDEVGLPGEQKDTLVDVDLGSASDEAATRPEEQGPPRGALATPVPAPRSARITPRAHEPDEHPEGPAEPDRAPAPSPAAPADTLDPNPPPAAPLPGLDGKPIWALPGVLLGPAPLASRVAAAPPPVVPSAPPSALGPMAYPSKALDYLGSGVPKRPPPEEPTPPFPAAGTFASSLADAVRSSSTPPESETTFEIVVDAQGALVSVTVVAASAEHRKEWERVAGTVAARFTGQTFTLPDAFAGGSRIRVTVKSHLTMPDGTKHGISMPLPKFAGLPSEKDIKEDSIDDRFRGTIKGSLPPVKLSIGLSIDFDLANIGAKRKRVIRTRFHATPLARATSQGAADPRR